MVISMFKELRENYREHHGNYKELIGNYTTRKKDIKLSIRARRK